MPRKTLSQNIPENNFSLTPPSSYRPSALYFDPDVDNSVFATLLADACRIAADKWSGSEEIELAERIAATPRSQAVRIINLYGELARVLELTPEPAESDLSAACLTAIDVLKSVLKGRPQTRKFGEVQRARAVLANTYLKIHLERPTRQAEKRIDSLLHSDEVTTLERFRAACLLAASVSRDQGDEDTARQYDAFALILATASPVERAEIYDFFIAPIRPVSLDANFQTWIERITSAISALGELRAVLSANRPTPTMLDIAWEQIDAAELGDWLESIGDVDALFNRLAEAAE